MNQCSIWLLWFQLFITDLVAVAAWVFCGVFDNLLLFCCCFCCCFNWEVVFHHRQEVAWYLLCDYKKLFFQSWEKIFKSHFIESQLDSNSSARSSLFHLFCAAWCECSTIAQAHCVRYKLHRFWSGKRFSLTQLVKLKLTNVNVHCSQAMLKAFSGLILKIQIRRFNLSIRRTISDKLEHIFQFIFLITWRGTPVTSGGRKVHKVSYLVQDLTRQAKPSQEKK